VAINNWIKTSEMAMNGRKKYGKMNLCKRELTMYRNWQIRMYEK